MDIKIEKFFYGHKGCRIIDGQLAIVYQYGYLSMPTIKKQKVELENLRYRGFQNTRRFDERTPKDETVGFFIEDKKFQGICQRPWNYVEWLQQYKQIFSPDISCYFDMSKDEQWFSVYLNRLIGSYFQSQGIIVIPTVSWGDKSTFEFCFDGIEKGSDVAISTIGTKNNYEGFMVGFRELCKRIEPEAVFCYCTPYPKMYQYANIIAIEHEGTRAKREAKNRVVSGQLSLFDDTNELKEVV